MSLPHEDAAREKYPNAHEFEAVIAGVPGLGRGLIGWVFECKKDASSSYQYAWITISHEVTADPTDLRSAAVAYLRSYVKNRRRVALGLERSVKSTGDATVTGGGTANTGIVVTGVTVPSIRKEER